MNGLRAAIAFLTVVPAGVESTAADRRAAVPWYPAIGLAMGGALAALTVPADALWPPPVRAALLVAVWAALSGGLHLDGLADTADAAFAPVDGVRRREILRDVHHGTFAVVAVALVLLLKVAVLGSLPRAETAAMALAAPVLGRTAVLPAMRIRPARAGGMGAGARTGASAPAMTVAALLAVAVAAAVLGWWAFVPLVAVAAVTGLAAWWLARRFDGLTGDCYGATIELAEVAALLAMSAVFANASTSAFPWGSRA